MSDNDYYNMPAESAEGITREAPTAAKAVSTRGARDFTKVLPFKQSKDVKPFGATKADRMNDAEVKQTIDALVKAYELVGKGEEVLTGFLYSVCWFHTINSASVVQPDRTYITVEGEQQPATMLLLTLGNRQRQFFRGIADLVRTVNKRVMEGVKDGTQDSLEKYNLLRQVAEERGLGRHMDLAHDSAEACWGLSPEELSAIARSKTFVLGRTNNFADSFRGGSRVPTDPAAIYADVSASRNLV